MFSGGVGVFHVKGWGATGAKKFGMCFETQGNQTFGGISRDFAGIFRGRPKSLRKKGLCPILVPYICEIFWSRRLQSGIGVNFLFWSSEFEEIAGEFLSEF